MDRPGNLTLRSTRGFRPHAGADQRPRASRAAGIRHGQGDQPARAHLSSPRTQGTGGGGATAYAEVVVRGDVQRRGGARERRASVAVRRRWERLILPGQEHDLTAHFTIGEQAV